MTPPRPRSKVPLPTPAERVQKSLFELAARGGKRLTLRLEPESVDALQTIMQVEQIGTETAAINQTLVARAAQLRRRAAKK